jgi:hypothetical protein
MRNQSIFNSKSSYSRALWSWLRILRSFVWVPLISLSLVFLVGCDDDDDDFSSSGNTLSISDIQGSWIANSATFSGDQFVDMLEEPASVTLSIASNGRFTFSILKPGEDPETIATGKLGFDGDFLAVRFDDDDEEASFFISLENGILTLRGQTEMDLDDDGVYDFGILELIMERN